MWPCTRCFGSWRLTIVSATGGTCGGLGGCSDLYVQVNNDSDRESNGVSDSDDGDIVNPVWDTTQATLPIVP